MCNNRTKCVTLWRPPPRRRRRHAKEEQCASMQIHASRIHACHLRKVLNFRRNCHIQLNFTTSSCARRLLLSCCLSDDTRSAKLHADGFRIKYILVAIRGFMSVHLSSSLYLSIQLYRSGGGTKPHLCNLMV